MCGISGWAGSPDRERAERMSGAIRHRGPDERGEYTDTSATLRHERLSIIDLKGGHQPLSNEDDRYQIVFNGEIYNYSQLRAQLESRGHRFRTTSDTEVIVHLYEDEGERCPERLLGMFAFAIWDTREKTLFLARDRMGIKPLFYAEANGEFVFASELKAILASGVVPRRIDPESLDMYLTFMYVPAPRTIVAGINKLLPGQTLTWKEGRARLRTYWELPPAETAAHPPHKEAVDELTALLEDAVKIRLMSEVPLGAYLSGGLDSSLVVALMSRASDAPVNTFSVGFEERAFDERQWSRLVAEKFHTRHEELIVRHHSAEELPKIIHALDEPVADSAAIPTYFMAEVTKPHVTVVLTGEGADEIFAGYSHYKILLWGDRFSALGPGPAARAMSGLFSSMPRARGMEYLGRLRDRAGAYLALKSVFGQGEKDSLYASDGLRKAQAARPAEGYVRRYLKPGDGPYLHQLLRLDMAAWLPDDLLVKVDRMTMAHAVEARVPYLDHRVVEAVMRLPASWKLRAFAGKRLLRDVSRPVLPPEIVTRRKTGFAVPVGEWAASEMRGLVQDVLGEKSVRSRGLFKPEAVSPLLKLDNFNMFQRRQLWTLLCLELWCREFMD